MSFLPVLKTSAISLHSGWSRKSQRDWILSKHLPFWQDSEIYVKLNILLLLLQTSVCLPRGCFSPTLPSPVCRSLICTLFCSNTSIFPDLASAIKKDPLWCFQGGLTAVRAASSGGQILGEDGEYLFPDPKAGTDSTSRLEWTNFNLCFGFCPKLGVISPHYLIEVPSRWNHQRKQHWGAHKP